MSKCQKIENCPAKFKRAELIEVAGACDIPGMTNKYKSPYRNMKWLCEEIDRIVDTMVKEEKPKPLKEPKQKILIKPLKPKKAEPAAQVRIPVEPEPVKQAKEAKPVVIKPAGPAGPVGPAGDVVCKSGNNGKVVFTGAAMLAQTVKDVKTFDPVGWYASEKYDGFRSIWNGKQFVSRQGNPFQVPKWFSALMPPGISLDGEFWMGRCKFEACGLFRHNVPDDAAWIASQPRYLVFDIHMESDMPFEERMAKLKALVDERCQCLVQVGLPEGVIEMGCPLVFADQFRVKDKESLMRFYKDIIKEGAEGVMLRKPGSLYEQKRSYTLMKVKPEFDSECAIVGYKPGAGKYAGMLGSFQCEWDSPVGKKVRFYLSGMTDDIRKTYKSTHPLGTQITFTYKGLTKNGVPRNPNYMRLFQRP